MSVIKQVEDRGWGRGHRSSVQQKCELNEGQEQRVITQFRAFLSSGLHPCHVSLPDMCTRRMFPTLAKGKRPDPSG